MGEVNASLVIAVEKHHHTQRRTAQPRMRNTTSGKKEHLKISFKCKKGEKDIGKSKDMDGKVKTWRNSSSVQLYLRRQHTNTNHSTQASHQCLTTVSPKQII